MMPLKPPHPPLTVGRRAALSTMAVATGSALAPRLFAATTQDVVLGLQLYSLREQLTKNVAEALHQARALGFVHVEVFRLYGHGVAEFSQKLRASGLRCRSYMVELEAFADTNKVIAEAKELGASYVTCPWIPHEKPFSPKVCAEAAERFTTVGRALHSQGLSFAYHIHGYEFEPSPAGTLMDTLLQSTPAEFVNYEMDIFWVTRGGGNAVDLLQRYPGRFPLMHLKDIAKGTAICAPKGGAPDDTSVPLGAGMIDLPKVIAAARASGTKVFFVEDEHPHAAKQIPVSLRYLKSLGLRPSR